MNKLIQFREHPLHPGVVADFLQSETGRELTVILRELRTAMTSDQSISEGRVCGRHDVFQKLEDFFSLAPQYFERAPRHSEKSGAPRSIPAAHRAPLP